jgi:hypothetical protein
MTLTLVNSQVTLIFLALVRHTFTAYLFVIEGENLIPDN